MFSLFLALSREHDPYNLENERFPEVFLYSVNQKQMCIFSYYKFIGEWVVLFNKEKYYCITYQ